MYKFLNRWCWELEQSIEYLACNSLASFIFHPIGKGITILSSCSALGGFESFDILSHLVHIFPLFCHFYTQLEYPIHAPALVLPALLGFTFMETNTLTMGLALYNGAVIGQASRYDW